MITFRASAVCCVRDGYTGGAIEASRLLCALDGAPYRPLGKPGGYLVLLNLSAGVHRLELRSAGYQEEWVEFRTGRGTQELEITMKPGAQYPFPLGVTRLTLTCLERDQPAVGRQLWLAAPGAVELKIAQTKAEAGSQSLRLFAKGPVAPAVPGTYLISDGANSEIVLLRALEEEIGEFLTPLQYAHSRGRPLLPAQRYHTDDAGTLSAVFREPCTVELCHADGKQLTSFKLNEGENQETVSLEIEKEANDGKSGSRNRGV